MAILTKEILAGPVAVQIPRQSFTRGFELLNLGPDAIWVSLDDPSACVAGKCRRIQTGEAWSVQGTRPPFVLCTVQQVTGAATVFTEAL